MKLLRHISSLMSSNMYVLQESRHVLVVDPCCLARFDELFPADVDLCYVYLTHEHYDHISGVNLLKQKFPECRVICSEACAVNIKNTRKNFSSFFSAFCEMQTMFTVTEEATNVSDYTCTADVTFNTSYCCEWCGHKLNFVETPGHSEGSSCLLVDDDIVFCGDSMFRDYPTQLRFPGGNRKNYINIAKPILSNLPKEMIVYPGHLDSFVSKNYNWQMA